MAQYFTGKGYGVSNIADISGRPLLTYQGAGDKTPITLYDRVAQPFDVTIAQPIKSGVQSNARLDSATSAAIKSILGGGSDDELDHKISLELGGSNTPANLWVQNGIKSGASAASDTIENNLAVDVVAGKISLERAWEILSEQKGFLMSEKATTKPAANWLDTLKTLAHQLATTRLPGFFGGILSNFISIITHTQQQTIQQTYGVSAVDPILKGKIDEDIKLLSSQPLNQKLLTQIFQEQANITRQQLNVSDKEAGKTVGSFLAGYAQSKGINPVEVMTALNADVQKIVNDAGRDPNIFGINSITITKIVAALQVGSTALVGVGIALAVIGIFLAGPEVVLGALSGGLLESIGAIFGVSALTGIGLTSFAVGEAFNVAAIGLNMSVKSTYDNGYLLPTQQITALKDALAIQKGLAGFLPSTQSTTPNTPTTSAVAGSPRVVGSKTGLFIGHIDSGHLQAVVPFKPQEFQNISNPDDLAAAAQHNLAAYLSSLAGVLDYDIVTKAHVTLPDGTELLGNTVYIPTSVSKKGVTHYKKIQDKFAVAQVFIKTSAKGRIHLEDLILGPIDETKYQPTQSELVDLANKLDAQLITTSTQDIKAITLAPPTSGTPTTTPSSANTPTTTAPSAYPIADPRTPKYWKIGSLYYEFDATLTGNWKDIPNAKQQTGGYGGTLVIRTEKEIQDRLGDKNKSNSFATNFANLVSAGDAKIFPSAALPDLIAFIENANGYVPDNVKQSQANQAPYVIFAGSPDVFNRATGKYVTTAEAAQLNIFANGLIEHLPNPRPEVKTATDFAGFAGKDLANFPV